MIDWMASSKRIALGVDDLLTTRQLQELLQVDRITIYRMLNDGRLHGFKVGGQWRFSRQEIEAWLQEQRVEWEGAEESDRAAEAALPSRVLSLSCVQAIQSVCAEALGIAVITIELDGTPYTDISNSCQFCTLILSSKEGKRRCTAAWQSVANGKPRDCHAGLFCVGAPVEVDGQPVAITAGCQFAVQPADGEQPAWWSNLPTLIAELGLQEQDVRTAARSVRLVPEDHLDRISRLLVRVADTFAEIGRERLSLLSRLEYIAEVSRV
jgi:excisionase family DNA binding protein